MLTSHKVVGIDHILQTMALLVINPFLMIIALGGGGNVIGLLMAQFCIGAYQFLTAWGHYFRPNLSSVIKRRRGLHLIMSILVLSGFLFVSNFNREIQAFFPIENYHVWIGLAIFFGIIIPQCLAYYYYWITHQDNNEQENRQKIEYKDVSL